MHTGMLWFDNSQSTLPVKIQKAIEYYVKKYGRQPDMVLVHPSMLEKEQTTLEVNRSRSVHTGRCCRGTFGSASKRSRPQKQTRPMETINKS